MEDRLAIIFENQAYLQERMGNPMGTGEEAVYHNIMGIISETQEVLAEINWKRWKEDYPNYKEVDRDKLLIELTDILQFWVNACQVMGFDASDVFAALAGKWRVNHARISEKY